MKLSRNFYNRPTLKVAQDLLGKFLIHQTPKRKIKGEIVETEAYVGPHDKASHASRGLTPRTQLMFGPAGFAYIYLIYGMYYCFNIVTERSGYPAAVLIRGLKVFDKKNQTTLFYNGPGKLTRFMKIDKTLNGVDLTDKILWLEDCGQKIQASQMKPPGNYAPGIPHLFGLPARALEWQVSGIRRSPAPHREAGRRRIKRTKRIGIDYAQEYRDKLWRFVLEN